jgi:putative oxidoreductase
MWIAFDLLTRFVIGGSLLLAGMTKLISTVAWRQVWLAAYRMLPRPLVRPVALGLPAAEIGCGVAVLSGALGAGSALAGASLLAALAAIVAVSLARSLEVSCHCLTMVGEVISWRGVARNLVLAAAASAVAWHGGRDLLGASSLGWPVQLAMIAVAAAAMHWLMLAGRAARRRRVLVSIGGRIVPGAGGAG